MSQSRPWFRMYGEVLDDRKLAWVAKSTGQPKALILGVWTGLLALANESPRRGWLLLTETVALDDAAIAEAIGIDQDLLLNTYTAFRAMDMITYSADGKAMIISHWAARQFESDNSTERVREHRERQKQQESPPTETLPQRFGNDDVAPSETESESESDTDANPEFVPLGINPTTGLKPAHDGQQRHVDTASRGGQSKPVEPLDAVTLHHYQGFMGGPVDLPGGKAERTKWTEAGKRILQRVGDRSLREVLMGIDEWWVKPDLDAFWKDKPCKDETLDLIARHCASNGGPPQPEKPKRPLTDFAIPSAIRAEEEARRAPH